MGVMRKHDLTNKKTMTKKNTNTSREHLQRAILTFETFDQSDEKTQHGQQKDNDEDKDKDKYRERTPPKSNF